MEEITKSDATPVTDSLVHDLGILCRMRLTINWNQKIDTWRKVPIIKKLNLSRFIGNMDAKNLYFGLSLLTASLRAIVVNFIYVCLFMFLPMVLCVDFATPDKTWTAYHGFLSQPVPGNLFLVHYLILTIWGTFANLNLLSSDLDTEYSVFLLRMSARNYAIGSHLIQMVTTLFAQLPFLYLFGALSDLPKTIYLLLPVITIALKQIGAARKLQVIIRRKRLSLMHDGNKRSRRAYTYSLIINGVIILAGIALVVSEFLLEFSFTSRLLYPLMGVILASGLLCGIRVFTYKNYHELYLYLRKEGDFQIEAPIDATASTVQEALEQEDSAPNEELDTNAKSTKKGYDAFHEIFMKRHKKLMTRSANRLALITLAIVVIIFLGGFIFSAFTPGVKEAYQNLGPVAVPFTPLLLYWMNRGSNMTNAMFMNCDHAMLAYSFYREPETILAMFKRRLLSLVRLNLRPAAAVALFFPLCSLVGHGSILSETLLYSITVLLLSVFFSIHTLVMYYLLQPFDLQNQNVGRVYQTISFITYVVCYTIKDLAKDSLLFCILVAAFVVIYATISLFLVQKYAPRTFKLR